MTAFSVYQLFLETFNGFHRRLQFMLQYNNKSINFLNVRVFHNDDEGISTNWYIKNVWSLNLEQFVTPKYKKVSLGAWQIMQSNCQMVNTALKT